MERDILISLIETFEAADLVYKEMIAAASDFDEWVLKREGPDGVAYWKAHADLIEALTPRRVVRYKGKCYVPDNENDFQVVPEFLDLD